MELSFSPARGMICGMPTPKHNAFNQFPADIELRLPRPANYHNIIVRQQAIPSCPKIWNWTRV